MHQNSRLPIQTQITIKIKTPIGFKTKASLITKEEDFSKEETTKDIKEEEIIIIISKSIHNHQMNNTEAEMIRDSQTVSIQGETFEEEEEEEEAEDHTNHKKIRMKNS
jgi:hypothetical protein